MIVSVPALLALTWVAVQPPVSTAPPLVPRALYFADRDKVAVQLSPSGRYVGWIATGPAGRRLEVQEVAATGGRPRTVATNVASWLWTFADDGMLVVVADGAGQELQRRAVAGGEPDVLLRARAVSVAALGRDVPGQAVVNVRGADKTPDGFARLTFADRTLEPIEELRGYATPYFDGRLRLVAAQRFEPLTAPIELRTAGGRWSPLVTVDAVDVPAAGVVAVSRDGSRIAFTTNHASDTTQLEELELATGARRVVARDPGADILRAGATINPEDGRVESVVSYRVRLLRHVLNRGLLDHFNHLEEVGRADVSIGGQSLDNRTWLVRFFDGGPTRFAVYDLATRKLVPLFSEIPALDGQPLARRHDLSIKSRDGLPLWADVYLPPGSDADGNGVPDRPLPAMVFVHGGPWVGFEWNIWEANRHFQLLANRGYAVIRATFRGEPGFGKKFVDASNRQWSGGMMNDIADIAAAAASRRIADPARTGVFGWSFGGFATARLLSTQPESFRCGIALYGVYDLPSILATPFASNDFWRTRVGDPSNPEERARLTAESPLTSAGKLTRPLLLTHGARDTRVPLAQSEAFAAALEKEKKPATFIVFPDEGHDYGAAATWEAFWAVAERFLAQHLGGRYEPMKGELDATRAEVRSGGAHIPGLADKAAR